MSESHFRAEQAKLAGEDHVSAMLLALEGLPDKVGGVDRPFVNEPWHKLYDAHLQRRERAVLTEQAKESGKPAPVIEKMVEGRLRKFYEEVVLLAQSFVHDADTTVAKAMEAAGKKAGAPIKITGFHRFALGEGIDRGESDFAAEVAAAASQS